uniref:Ig-like domain-containing protein n=1 Tax=Neolamprologus brichardi TaxID=32507 RepID=A0A3Q4I9N8_NEOBR
MFTRACPLLLLHLLHFLIPTGHVKVHIRAHICSSTVTLPCRAPNSGNPIIAAEWSRADLEQKYVLFYRDDKLDTEEQHPSFKNRVDLQDRQMKDGGVSLILKDVTTADGGTYECCVVHEVREGRKLAVLKTEPISVIQLKVISPGKSVEFSLCDFITPAVRFLTVCEDAGS